MTPQGQLVVAVVACLAALWMLHLTRSQKLTIGYGLFWLLVFLGAAFLAIWPGALWFVTELIGAKFPVSAMTLLGFVIVMGILIVFSVKLSRLHMQVISLTRYIGELEHELGRKRPADPS
jgi:hypothetical protein